MASTLPNPATDCCLTDCDDVVVQNVPGPTGDDGADGADGADGVSAITTLTVQYTMPAELATAVANVGSTAGMVIGEPVFVQTLGVLKVTAIGSATQATLQNLEDTPNSAYASNAAPGTIAAIGSRVGPTGFQGSAGLLAGGAAGGQLKGTYPNPNLAIPNALGALVAGNGTDAASLSAGTNGQIPAYDSTQPLGIIPKSIIPVTGGTDVAIDRLVRLSSATGTPIALESTKISFRDPAATGGLLVADNSAGNARGIDAVDLQVARNVVGASGVASGDQSVIAGGQDNTASGLRSVICGGQGHIASGQETFIGGGDENEVDSTQGTIAGGDENSITGGAANESFIGGGKLNAITGNGQATIAGGISNAVSGQYGSIAGGNSNIVSNTGGSIVGGQYATADKYGQRAFSAGRFAAQADCQQCDVIWRIATINATPAEAFLDGSSARYTIAAGRSVVFDILIIGRSDAGVTAAWRVVGTIQNNAGTTALVTGGVTATLINDGTGGTWGAVGNVPVVAADNGNDALIITVTGAGATNIRWTMHGRMMEVAYGS